MKYWVGGLYIPCRIPIDIQRPISNTTSLASVTECYVVMMELPRPGKVAVSGILIQLQMNGDRLNFDPILHLMHSRFLSWPFQRAATFIVWMWCHYSDTVQCTQSEARRWRHFPRRPVSVCIWKAEQTPAFLWISAKASRLFSQFQNGINNIVSLSLTIRCWMAMKVKVQTKWSPLWKNISLSDNLLGRHLKSSWEA